MQDKILKYPAGKVIEFSSGEYSDYRTCGLIVTIKDCDLPKLAQEFSGGKARYDTSHDEFATWLVANGYAMPVESALIHLGSYGEWEPEFGVKYKED